MKFMDRVESKKGEYGEKLVDAILKKQFSIYLSKNYDTSHPIDRLLVDKRTLKIYGLDVKTKSARMYFPDTGIDTRHFKIYQELNEKIPVILVFVDEEKKEIYGNKLSKLIPNSKEQNKIVYFLLSDMITLGKISDEDASVLKELTTKKSCYQKDGIPYNEN